MTGGEGEGDEKKPTLLVLPFELLAEVIDESVVEIFSSQVGISGGGFDFEDTAVEVRGKRERKSAKEEEDGEAFPCFKRNHSPFLDGQERYIESSSSEIEDENILLPEVLGLVESGGREKEDGRQSRLSRVVFGQIDRTSEAHSPVSDSSGGRLVDDSKNVETSDDSGVLGSLSLRVVEVFGLKRREGISDSEGWRTEARGGET